MAGVFIRVLFLTITIGLINSSCAETKINQCRAIIEIANGTVDQARELTDGGKSTDPEAALLAADTMELAAEEMASLEITDEPLQGYQQEFVEMYEETAQATRSFVRAYEKTDQTDLKQARKRLQAATDPEKKLVTEINQYCLE
jgi:hypothetical protein